MSICVSLPVPVIGTTRTWHTKKAVVYSDIFIYWIWGRQIWSGPALDSSRSTRRLGGLPSYCNISRVLTQSPLTTALQAIAITHRSPWSHLVGEVEICRPTAVGRTGEKRCADPQILRPPQPADYDRRSTTVYAILDPPSFRVRNVYCPVE